MSDILGYGFSEAHAQRVAESLEECLSTMDETIEFVKLNCDPRSARAYRLAIGKVIANLYMDVLEKGIYGQHPRLRPEPSSRGNVVPPEAKEPQDPQRQLNLADVPLLELLAEALYRGRSEFVPDLVAHEPISILAIDAELMRRSGAAGQRQIEDWVDWYLASGRLSDEDSQILAVMMRNKKRFDAIDVRPSDDRNDT